MLITICYQNLSYYNNLLLDLLQDEVSVSNVKETCDVQNQCFNKKKSCKVLDISNRRPTQLSPLLNGEEKVQDYIDNILTVQNSFTDVVKAKINFDTKFLGFEAVLHKATSTSTDAVCLCQYCSSIMVIYFTCIIFYYCYNNIPIYSIAYFSKLHMVHTEN